MRMLWGPTRARASLATTSSRLALGLPPCAASSARRTWPAANPPQALASSAGRAQVPLQVQPCRALQSQVCVWRQ